MISMPNNKTIICGVVLLCILTLLFISPLAEGAVTTVSYSQSTTNYLSYTFTSNATVDYLWTFDDGTTYATQNCTHTFAQIGSHWVNITSEATYVNTSLTVPYKFNRPQATNTISYNDTGAFDVIENNGTFSLENITTGISISYTSLLGNFFYFFCFGVPILMIWIRTESVVIPTILGMLIGSFTFTFLPPEYEYAAMIFMILAIAGMFTVIFRSKK